MTLIAGLVAYRYLIPVNLEGKGKPTSTIKPTTIVGQRRPDFTMTDVEGKQRSASEWDGKVMLINFWATWCPPCRREIPAFIKLQDDYRDKGLVIVGIALDSQQAAIDYVDPMGINYPVLQGEIEGISLTQKYGNELGVLPYSVVVDRNGVIQHSFRNEVTYEDAEKLIKPLL
jgi:thiol-disulfide isomerase/thioredoxin